MPRKRGGLAGLWDRNKHIIKPIASGAGFLAGGPWGSAAVSGLMGGFDRKGKRGVGFDLGQGVKQGAAGYLGGRLAQGLGYQGGGGMKALGQMFRHPIKSTGSAFRRMGEIPANARLSGIDLAGRAQDLGQRGLEMGKGVARWAGSDPKNLLALGQTAMGGLNAYGTAQQNAMYNQQIAQRERESQQQQRIRELLMPYFQTYMQNMTGGG